MTTPPDPSRLPFGSAPGAGDYSPPSGAYTPGSYSGPLQGMPPGPPGYVSPQPAQYGLPYAHGMPSPAVGMPPGNSMVLSVIAICLGFVVMPIALGWVFGIIGAIRGSDVTKRWNVGDVAGAHQAARQAKNFSLIGIGLTVVGTIAVIAFYVVMVAVAV